MKLSADNATQHAERSIAFVQAKFGFELPYSPGSLLLVDAIVDKIRETGATERQASGLLSGLGCYAGEVFVRSARASWRSASEIPAAASSRSPIVVVFPGATACDPIARVFDRFTLGPAHSVASLYETVVPAAAVPAAAARRG